MRRSGFIMTVLTSIAIMTMWGCTDPYQFIAHNKEPQWNEYNYSKVERLTVPFESILGKKGTGWVIGSDLDCYDSPTRPIPVKFSFPFTILGDDYMNPADPGLSIQASVGGFFKFTTQGPIDPPYGASYVLMPAQVLPTDPLFQSSRQLDNLIMPYWGDLCGVAAQEAGFEGGMHYRYEDNPANNMAGIDMLTIEWKVRRTGSTQEIGNFQAKLILEETQSPWGRHYVTVEFHYGPNSLNWPFPNDAAKYMQGAAVGLKRRGQIDDQPAPFGSYPGIDDGNTLMITHPYFFPTATGPLWATRVPVHYGTPPPGVTINLFPEWFTSTPMGFPGVAPYSYSPFFHYSFPATAEEKEKITGYRVKPVDNDLLTVNAYPRKAMIPADSAHFTFDPNEPMLVKGTFKNQGSRTLVNVPVHARIYAGDSLRASTNSIIPSIDPGQTITITFPDTIRLSASTTLPAAHTLCVFHSNPADQHRGNDTACRYMFLRAPGSRDMGALELISPALKTPPERSIFPLGQPFTVAAAFGNTGAVTASNVPVGFRILDDRGREIYKASSVIRGNWPSGEQRTHTFTPWIPARPGLYYVEVFSSLSHDRIRENDTILSNPLGNFVWWGRDGRERPAHHIPFEVRANNDIGICDPKHYPHAPASGSHVRLPFRAAIFLRNYGMARSTGISLRLRITRPGSDRPLVGIEEQGTAIDPGFAAEHRFAGIAPGTLPPGTYQARVEVVHPGDTNPANNVIEWQFKVDP